jgi:adenylosuccinate lyase
LPQIYSINMDLNQLTAISPIDGRYRKQVQHLDEFYSEYALIKYRVWVEVEYFIFLAEKKIFKADVKLKKHLLDVVKNFSLQDAEKIKQTERITNHDVKAVEYFLKEVLDNCNAGHLKEWVHFGLTSQDINNTAIPLLWKNSIETEYLPAVINLQHAIYKLATTFKNVSMLARTHGQPASPVKLGKELMVFVERLEAQIQLFSYIPFTAKFGGATGGFNAHHVACLLYTSDAADESALV